MGTVVDNDPNLHHAQTLSLDFWISEAATNEIVIVSFSLRRVPCTVLFVIDIMGGWAKKKKEVYEGGKGKK